MANALSPASMTVGHVALPFGLCAGASTDDVTLTGGRIDGFDVKLNEEGACQPCTRERNLNRRTWPRVSRRLLQNMCISSPIASGPVSQKPVCVASPIETE